VVVPAVRPPVDPVEADLRAALAETAPGAPAGEALVAACRLLLAGTAGPATRAAAGRRGVAGLADRWPVLSGAGARRAAGAWYTPGSVVLHLAGLALPTGAGRVGVVADPACGTGGFLVAAARLLAARRESSVARVLRAGAVRGVERDPIAAELCRLVLAEAAAGPVPDEVVVVADALADPWPLDRDLVAVVGNPPFLTPLARATAPDGDTRADRRARFGTAAGPYTDAAALFALLALDVVRDGGRIALVQPVSFLGARDAAGVRATIARRATLVALWDAGPGGAFPGTGARPCAPVVELGEPRAGRCRRATGVPPRRRPAVTVRPDDLASRSWAGLVATAAGVPRVRRSPSGSTTCLGDHATVSADFRDRYYALVAHVVEGAGAAAGARLAPLVTAGLIDPCRCRWGERPARFAKQLWQAAAVDLDQLADDPGTAAWAAHRLVPKVLVASQTRVLEAVVDEDGAWLPSVPVLSVVASPERLWHVAAAVLSPSGAAAAATVHGGTALSPGSVRVTAPLLRDLPLPVDAAAWDDGAAAAETAQRAGASGDERGWQAALDGLGEAMVAAHAVAAADRPALLGWWRARLPR
jgi:SAM-dependent methyltransferase